MSASTLLVFLSCCIVFELLSIIILNLEFLSSALKSEDPLNLNEGKPLSFVLRKMEDVLREKLISRLIFVRFSNL